MGGPFINGLLTIILFKKSSKFCVMKAKVFAVLLSLLVFATGCTAQENKSVSNKQQGKNIQPQINWKVNKTYDKDGKVIGYDSSYFWSYIDTSGKTNNLAVDSVLRQFQKNFRGNYSSLFDSTFGPAIWTDSLFYRNFTKSDYFEQLWKNRMTEMNSMFRQMDSIRNNYLSKSYPGLINRKKD
jgi:hypothetical protein